MIYLDYSANTPVDEAVLQCFCEVERNCPGNANSRHAAGTAAKAAIDAIVFEPEVGAVYTGHVTGIKEFGAFVEYAPGKAGLVHISKITNRRLERVEDAGIEVGSVVKVQYLGLDKKGRMDFSIKDAQ